ncbi:MULTISPECIES: type II toxin-antitoxin system HicA family toxin [Paenibacillus]|uniref:type II toxin-antitoxin system HicA family toxin n=1 Tax=Paenibacillus TaxID=44249 RepID=UPI0022B9185B|nr:type II toxin-antitoxin system HicA family toxin [Paenibacillus caseinilyticus]MCZ8522597.1 type II toxin-antitoxin system HicA family toxin [Paenibacillus caseinilyticus]
MASWKDLRRFFNNDGWTHLPDRSGTDDWYVKTFPNGEKRYSRCSKGTGEISKGMFAKILKQQLKVDKEYFNSKL